MQWWGLRREAGQAGKQADLPRGTTPGSEHLYGG